MTQTIGCLTIDPKGRTTLPREMRDALGLSPDTLLRVDRTDSEFLSWFLWSWSLRTTRCGFMRPRRSLALQLQKRTSEPVASLIRKEAQKHNVTWTL